MLKKKDQRIARLRNELKKLQRLSCKNEQLAVKSMQQLAEQKLEAFTISKRGKAKEGRGGRLSLVSMFGIGKSEMSHQCSCIGFRCSEHG